MRSYVFSKSNEIQASINGTERPSNYFRYDNDVILGFLERDFIMNSEQYMEIFTLK